MTPQEWQDDYAQLRTAALQAITALDLARHTIHECYLPLLTRAQNNLATALQAHDARPMPITERSAS